ncbi:DUF2889 domain-containing protein [Sphingomonas sp. ID0503]|uniref:DUF2889 domain-containing protein n=1 Tax=Sphingomonas sp. ID0503 TaxID=3399691 RepID=UPI003AFAAE49
MIAELAHLPLNPHYGRGAFRRRLMFRPVSGGVVAQVDDAFHAYWLMLDHNGDRITGLDAGFLRAPTDMCPGSITGLEMLIGSGVRDDARQLMARLPQALNCTHLTDLAVWTAAHHERSATWDILVPDQVDTPAWITIARDGEIIHRWQLSGFQLSAPAALAGHPLMSGFIKWASRSFAGDALMAATMLQRGVFVARGRQHIIDKGQPPALSDAPGMAGMCWSYSGERWAQGRGALNYVRDFTLGVTPATLPNHVIDRLRDYAK